MSKSLKSLSEDELSLELDESSDDELSDPAFVGTVVGFAGSSSSKEEDSDSEEEDEELESDEESLCCCLLRR